MKIAVVAVAVAVAVVVAGGKPCLLPRTRNGTCQEASVASQDVEPSEGLVPEQDKTFDNFEEVTEAETGEAVREVDQE